MTQYGFDKNNKYQIAKSAISLLITRGLLKIFMVGGSYPVLILPVRRSSCRYRFRNKIMRPLVYGLMLMAYQVHADGGWYWRFGNLGESCDDVCGQGACDSSGFQHVGSETALQAIQGFVNCVSAHSGASVVMPDTTSRMRWHRCADTQDVSMAASFVRCGGWLTPFVRRSM